MQPSGVSQPHIQAVGAAQVTPPCHSAWVGAVRVACGVAWWVLQAAMAALAIAHVCMWWEGDLYDPPGRLCIQSTAGDRSWRPFAEVDRAAGVAAVYQVSDVLERTRSDFQVRQPYYMQLVCPTTIDTWHHLRPAQSGEVLDTPFFGRMLLLDNEIMITQRDEAHYHEMLAHVPLAYFPAASRVLIIGGGDGGTLAQVLKHTNVRAVTIVEIDEMVVRLSQRHFPELGAAFLDPRVHLVFADGGRWVAEHAAALRNSTTAGGNGGYFDVVLLDTTDFGNAVSLFQSTFYADLKALLRPGTGAVAFNVDSPSWAQHVVEMVSMQMQALYAHSALFQTWQPTYGSGHYAFMFASDTVHPLRTEVRTHRLRNTTFTSSHPCLWRWVVGQVDWDAFHAKSVWRRV